MHLLINPITPLNTMPNLHSHASTKKPKAPTARRHAAPTVGVASRRVDPHAERPEVALYLIEHVLRAYFHQSVSTHPERVIQW
jgi:hypothetical protein